VLRFLPKLFRAYGAGAAARIRERAGETPVLLKANGRAGWQWTFTISYVKDGYYLVPCGGAGGGGDS
jgi:hypothetical protein